jgi:hypothetical protein
MCDVRESRHAIRWREVGLQDVLGIRVMAHFDPETQGILESAAEAGVIRQQLTVEGRLHEVLHCAACGSTTRAAS